MRRIGLAADSDGIGLLVSFVCRYEYHAVDVQHIVQPSTSLLLRMVALDNAHLHFANLHILCRSELLELLCRTTCSSRMGVGELAFDLS